MTVPQGTVDKAATPETEASPYVVRAETPVYGGYVIVRDGKVLFIKGAVPGELVEVSIEEKKKDYSIAAVHSVLEPSSSRRRPPCPVFGICGGCQLQFMEYGRQVSIKEEILLETMKRIGTVDAVLSPSLTAHEFRYRHRGQFKVSRKGDIGFYHEGTRDVVPVEECPLMVDGINATLRGLRKADLRGVKEIQITSGDTQTLMIKGQMSDDTSQLLIESWVSGIAFDNGDSLGKDYISLDLNGLKYTVTPWSFFQSNWALNCVVVDAVTKQLSPLENKRILDLYAGAGNFSLPLALGASEVTAVEENPAAIEDGRRNAMLNSIRNCRFVNLSVEKSLEGKKKQQVEKLFGEAPYDAIVLDPPRPGVTSECLRRIMETRSKRIVYLSCNPATLARDVKKMNEMYDLESLSMIDFFPNTYHIEALAVLTLKGPGRE